MKITFGRLLLLVWALFVVFDCIFWVSTPNQLRTLPAIIPGTGYIVYLRAHKVLVTCRHVL